MREPFANVAGEGTVDDFGKRLLADVAERDLSAMVEATGDNATIVENCNVRVKRAACARDILLWMTIVAVFGLR